MENEVWKDIEGYEGIYQVSNLGRVRSLDRYIPKLCRMTGTIIDYFQKGKIMSLSKHHVGYMKVTLRLDSKQTTYDVHRLVAQAFVPNPENLPVVNHKDENKLNNISDNLEWCTMYYNVHYGTGIERMTAQLEKTPVAMFTMDGTLVRTFPSVVKAARYIGKPNGARNICNACKKNVFSIYGYRWSFVTDGKPEPLKPPKTDEEHAATNRLKSLNNGRQKAVEQLTPDGQLIATYRNMMEASRVTGIPYSTIQIRAKGISKAVHPYQWRFANQNKQNNSNGTEDNTGVFQ